MADAPDQSAAHRRATWVGLRTLRQRPKVVGETAGGEPVFEVRSVRLVLRDDSNHFNRLAQCSKCSREVPGAPVLTAADLDRPPHPVICKDCVRASVASRPLRPEKRAEPDRSVAAPPPPPPPEAPAAQPVDDARLAAVEVQLESALARLAELSAAAPPPPPDMSDAVRDGLAEIRTEVLAASEATSARLAALELQAQRSVQSVAAVVEQQRGELAALSAAVAETRAEVQRLASSYQEVALVRAGVEKLEGDMEPVRTHWPAVVQAIRDLARAHEQVQAGLDALAAQTRDAEARTAAISAAVAEGANRIRAVEARARESADRLTAPQNRRLDGGGGQTAAGGATPGELLDGLERQLLEAEGRLARLSATRGDVG